MKTEVTLASDLQTGNGKRPAKNGRRLGMASVVQVIIKYIVITAISVAFLLPFLWLLSSSLKSSGQEFILPPQWWPKPFKWANFPDVFSYIPFARFYLNTVIVQSAQWLVPFYQVWWSRMDSRVCSGRGANCFLT
ncbi:hypothetical protein NZD89_19430 [Alicyclobacillus fastidiosus]|uniref:Carbohydrate ABC transporter permease n=1 Tax=Alicyclobacillus fastidiosus TaxID=392011 RepID=A0ABY6ZE91_9BACL|nr:hypothetical protein [Alicyclobacillus fastidiosus]WAH40484.1 hypothetical protein NZD89_19430 [Alicyclobacillus fastidiosus]GMA61898.1 hypothetical protein GCM10025859_23380 [Alicyclobacillus fastidiosus]